MSIVLEYYEELLTRKLDTLRKRYEAWADRNGYGVRDEKTGRFVHYEIFGFNFGRDWTDVLDYEGEEVDSSLNPEISEKRKIDDLT